MKHSFSNAGGTADKIRLFAPEYESVFRGYFYTFTGMTRNHIRKGVDKMSNIYRDVTLNQVSEKQTLAKTLRDSRLGRKYP